MSKGHVTIGPGQTIASDWGNTVWNQSVQTFTSAADRTNQYPSPLDGAVSYLEDTDCFYGFISGSWQVLAAPVNFAAGGSTSLPANTDYGVGALTVSEGGFRVAGSTDSLFFNKAGMVLLHALFYMPGAVERACWIGEQGGNTKSAVAWAGATTMVDRLSLSYIRRVAAGNTLVFGQRATAGISTTITVQGVWLSL